MPSADTWVWTQEDLTQLLADAAGGLVQIAALVALALVGFAMLARIAR